MRRNREKKPGTTNSDITASGAAGSTDIRSDVAAPGAVSSLFVHAQSRFDWIFETRRFEECHHRFGESSPKGTGGNYVASMECHR